MGARTGIIEHMRKSLTLSTQIEEVSRAYSTGMRSVLTNLAREDVGWKGFGDNDIDVVPLPVIKDHARRARHLAAYNPLVKRGLTIRNAYMWHDLPQLSTGAGVRRLRAVEDALVGLEARQRDEAAFCTDGAVVYLVSKTRGEIRPVPVSRVGGVARSEDSAEEGDIRAMLIEPVPLSDAIAVERPDPKWYCVDGYPYTPVESAGNQYETDKEWRVVYAFANRQVGESWGKPDLMGAVYWARAYKEYLESSATLAKALARIAFRVTSTNVRQQQAVIQQMSQLQGAGGTASLGQGQELQAVNKAGAGIDFTAGTPLAAMVSAALDVPLSVLLTDGSAGGRQGAETALEEPTLKALELRRQLHVNLIKRLLAALGLSTDVTLIPLTNELIQRWGQVVTLGTQNGLLHQVEARQLFLDRFQPRNAHPVDDLPELPAEGTTGVGPLSDGTNANRDETGGETVA